MALLRQQEQDLTMLEQMDNKRLLAVLHMEQQLNMTPSARYEQLKPLLAYYVEKPIQLVSFRQNYQNI